MITVAGAGEEVVDVAVVGAGVAGLATALRLAQRGSESFVVLERGDGVGGTWRDNRYPGVACDVPAHLYSYSFRPEPGWSRRYAPGAEVLAYLRACADEAGLAPHLRLGADVRDARWDAAARCWRLRWDGAGAGGPAGGRVRARVLVMAVGRLSEPARPDLPGLAGFDGPVLHSSRWAPGTDLAGARVGVVGTGASAAQLVPALAGSAARVVVLQRSAPWVVPRGDRATTAAERARAATPAGAAALRREIAEEMDAGLPARLAPGPARDALRERARAHLAAQVPPGPLRDALTPRYEVGCKRVLLSDDWYPALQRDDVVLEPSALAALEGPGRRTAVAASGARHALDALVLATGFTATRPPFAERVTGRGGRVLARHWARGMTSHASTAVHGFPDLFVLDGPAASLGHSSAVDVIEAQVDHVLGALDHLAAHPGAVLEATAAAERAYTAEVDAMGAGTVWATGGCTSWYRDAASGRLTLLWPGTARAFRERNAVFDPSGYALTR